MTADRILGIETSCDETAAAVVRRGTDGPAPGARGHCHRGPAQVAPDLDQRELGQEDPHQVLRGCGACCGLRLGAALPARPPPSNHGGVGAQDTHDLALTTHTAGQV